MEQSNNQVNPVFAGMAYVALRNAMDLARAETKEEQDDILDGLELPGTDPRIALYGLLLFVEKEMRNDLFPALGIDIGVTEGNLEDVD